MRARGGLTVAVEWKDGKAVSAELVASLPGQSTLRPPKGQRISALRLGAAKAPAKTNANGTVTFKLEPGEVLKVQLA